MNNKHNLATAQCWNVVMLLAVVATTTMAARWATAEDSPGPQRITLAQIYVTQDVAKNLNRMRDCFAQAKQDKAAWILFPEGSLSGYYDGFDQDKVASAFEAIRQLCRDAKVNALVGTCWKEDGKTTNEIRIVDSTGKLVGRYAKTCLTYGDAKQFTKGAFPLVHSVAGLTCGTLICNDLWVTPGFTDGPNPHLSLMQAKAGAQVIFHAVNSGSNQKYREYHESNLRLRSAEAKCPIVVVNAAHDQPINCASGVVRDFEYVVSLPREGEVIQTVEFTPGQARIVDRKLASGSAWAAKLTSQQVADRVVAEFMQREKIGGGYTNDLTLEALLAMYDATGDRKYLEFVSKVLSERRIPPNGFPSYRSQPFNCITISLFERTGEKSLIEPYIAEMNEYRQTAPRSFDGAVSHYGDPKMGRILIDQVQDYSARMARAGWLSGDESFYREAVDQYRLFREALRDPKTGLWGHARGWYDDPRTVTATPWGRGHGWLMKGFVETLSYLPEDSDEARHMRTWLDDFAQSLLKYQDEQGMWHQVLDRPDSYSETSSTGLISYYFARAVRQGYLDEATFRKPAIKAYEGLLKNSVAAVGTVYRTCRGTGPQRTVEDYLVRETPQNDQHGIAAVIFACAGRLLMDGQGTLPPNVKRHAED